MPSESTAEARETTWDELRPLLLQQIRDNLASPPGQRLPITELLRMFAQTHGKSESAVRQYYYGNLRPVLGGGEPAAGGDGRAGDGDGEDAGEDAGEGMPPLSLLGAEEAEPAGRDGPYPVAGSVIDVTVTGLAPFGAFAVTDQGVKGLIHISEITEAFVSDVANFFCTGERLRVKVIDADHAANRYAFSTKRLGGKEALRVTDRRPRVANGRGAVETPPAPAAAAGKEEAEVIGVLRDRFHEEAVSREARQEIGRLLAVYGPVRLAVALTQVLERFDASLAALKLAGERLDYQFNRR